MLKGRLLGSVCALGLLAAAPAFAAGPTTGDATSGGSPAAATTGTQNNATSTANPGGAAGAATNMPNTQGMAGTSSGTAGMSNAGSTNATATGMNSTNAKRSHMATARNHAGMHASNTHGSRHAMRMSRSGQTDTSQDAAVADLNEQSLQAAQQGHTFQVGSGMAPESATSNQGAPPGTMGGMNSGGMTGNKPSTGNK
jgi:hypothetical protein